MTNSPPARVVVRHTFIEVLSGRGQDDSPICGSSHRAKSDSRLFTRSTARQRDSSVDEGPCSIEADSPQLQATHIRSLPVWSLTDATPVPSLGFEPVPSSRERKVAEKRFKRTKRGTRGGGQSNSKMQPAMNKNIPSELDMESLSDTETDVGAVGAVTPLPCYAHLTESIHSGSGPSKTASQKLEKQGATQAKGKVNLSNRGKGNFIVNQPLHKSGTDIQNSSSSQRGPDAPTATGLVGAVPPLNAVPSSILSPTSMVPSSCSEKGRTSVMLRNLPNNYTRTMVVKMVDDEGYQGMYDFLYFPIDFRSHAGLGYAFVNLEDSETVPKFWNTFEGFSKWSLPSRKTCYVSWCMPHQGLEAHIERYRNSPVMHQSVPDEYKPVVFCDGIRVAFPPSTKAVRAPRLRG